MHDAERLYVAANVACAAWQSILRWRVVGHVEACTLSRAAYRAMRKDSVAASVPEALTTARPGSTPNRTPAVMVSGMAGMMASSSSA